VLCCLASTSRGVRVGRYDPIAAAEGMLKRMQLSEAEKKGFRIGGGGPPRAKPSRP
jgi:hypothetical protein